jgi:hypothetical protein
MIYRGGLRIYRARRRGKEKALREKENIYAKKVDKSSIG